MGRRRPPSGGGGEDAAREGTPTRDEVASAYLRARSAGTCPCHGPPDFYWGHWDVDGPCGIFPCPRCVDDNVHADYMDAVAAIADHRAEGDEDDHDETIPFWRHARREGPARL